MEQRNYTLFKIKYSNINFYTHRNLVGRIVLKAHSTTKIVHWSNWSLSSHLDSAFDLL